MMHIHHIYTIPARNIGNHFRAMLQYYCTRSEVRDILEVGTGDHPSIDLAILQRYQCNYTMLDSSQSEVDKAPCGYHKLCADITAEHIDTTQRYDIIFSHTVAEHIKDPYRFHKNVFNLLKPGGYAIHFFPTLFALPFIVNKLLPEWISSLLLKRFAPRDEYHQAKFTAYYRWCIGPSPLQIMRLLNRGYCIEEYWVFYGHDFYYTKIPLLQRLHVRKARWCAQHGISFFSSYAAVVLRKPLHKQDFSDEGEK